MAVTITQIATGHNSRKWSVVFGLDADAAAAIAHGMAKAPTLVHIVPRNVQAYTGQVTLGVVDATNINVAKNTAVGSGGAEVHVIAAVPDSALL